MERSISSFNFCFSYLAVTEVCLCRKCFVVLFGSADCGLWKGTESSRDFHIPLCSCRQPCGTSLWLKQRELGFCGLGLCFWCLQLPSLYAFKVREHKQSFSELLGFEGMGCSQCGGFPQAAGGVSVSSRWSLRLLLTASWDSILERNPGKVIECDLLDNTVLDTKLSLNPCLNTWQVILDWNILNLIKRQLGCSQVITGIKMSEFSSLWMSGQKLLRQWIFICAF